MTGFEVACVIAMVMSLAAALVIIGGAREQAGEVYYSRILRRDVVSKDATWSWGGWLLIVAAVSLVVLVLSLVFNW